MSGVPNLKVKLEVLPILAMPLERRAAARRGAVEQPARLEVWSIALLHLAILGPILALGAFLIAAPSTARADGRVQQRQRPQPQEEPLWRRLGQADPGAVDGGEAIARLARARIGSDGGRGTDLATIGVPLSAAASRGGESVSGGGGGGGGSSASSGGGGGSRDGDASSADDTTGSSGGGGGGGSGHGGDDASSGGGGGFDDVRFNEVGSPFGRALASSSGGSSHGSAHNSSADGGHAGHEGAHLPAAVLTIFGTLALGALIMWLLSNIGIPYTVLLLAEGMLFGVLLLWLEKQADWADALSTEAIKSWASVRARRAQSLSDAQTCASCAAVSCAGVPARSSSPAIWPAANSSARRARSLAPRTAPLHTTTVPLHTVQRHRPHAALTTLAAPWRMRARSCARWQMDAHVMLHIFLPPLIFESAFATEWRVFDQVKW